MDFLTPHLLAINPVGAQLSGNALYSAVEVDVQNESYVLALRQRKKGQDLQLHDIRGLSLLYFHSQS